MGSGMGFSYGDQHLSTSLVGMVISLPCLQEKLSLWRSLPFPKQLSPAS